MISSLLPLNHNNILLVYNGGLWPENISAIALSLKKRLSADGISALLLQKVYSVCIEQMNNMMMYSDENDNEGLPKGMFVIAKEGKAYILQSCNVIAHDSKGLIKNRIDYLNTLNKNEIRAYYKEQMKLKDNNVKSKGAGLGFIEVARRSSINMEYSFKPYKEGLVFFIFCVTIGETGENNDKSI